MRIHNSAAAGNRLKMRVRAGVTGTCQLVSKVAAHTQTKAKTNAAIGAMVSAGASK
jgi:hypothetical protein